MVTAWQEWHGLLQTAYFITSLNVGIIVKKLFCDGNYNDVVAEQDATKTQVTNLRAELDTAKAQLKNLQKEVKNVYIRIISL